MAKEGMNIIDIYVDGASDEMLERVNVKFNLQLPRRRFWLFKERTSTYRERVREGVRNYFNNMR